MAYVGSLTKETIISYHEGMATLPDVRTRLRGRPREFDLDAALDAALPVFRERGFHAASIADLGAATGLTAGSLYKAFADKRGLFLAAFERYTAQRAARLNEALARVGTGRERVRVLLTFYADSSFGVEGRRGCLVALAATELATFDAGMAARVTAALQRVEVQAGELVRLGQADGSIARALDPVALARTLLCLLQGMRVVGKVGASPEAMHAVVEQGMRLLD